MALIGSGTKVIPNVVSTGTWRSLDADQAFAAFVEQLGGIGWSGAVPTVYAGNLDATNFATGMALGTDRMAQPNARRAITFGTDIYPFSSTPVATSTTASTDMVVTSVHFGIGNVTAIPTDLTGTVKVKVNGGEVASMTIDVAFDAANLMRSVSIDSSFSIKAGDKVEVEFSNFGGGWTTLHDRHVTLVGYAGLTA